MAIFQNKLIVLLFFVSLSHIFNYIWFFQSDSKNLKVAICTMGRKENLYIKQFVQYYIKLGFDHIFIYDDNEPNTEKISDEIEKSYHKYVIVYENMKIGIKDQPTAYTTCYHNNKYSYDWIFMCDLDEYLVIKNDTLKNYLSNKIFNECDFIKIHWILSNDNNLLHYDKRPLLERFKGPYMNDTHIKTIVKGKIEDFHFYIHSPDLSPKRNVSCNNIGIKLNFTEVNFQDIFDINLDKAYIIHFKYKSTEEFINKYKRGYKNWFGSQFLPLKISEYFQDNQVTLEKIEYIEKELKLNLSQYREKIK